MEIYSIGFTRKSARQFFDALRRANITRLIDVRLNNTGQLAGFTKSKDLAFFLDELCRIEYIHEPLFAPSAPMLKAYKMKKEMSWEDYARDFTSLLSERRIEDAVPRELFRLPTVLLCSEPTAEQCHRRLVLEYLKEKWSGLKIVHL